MIVCLFWIELDVSALLFSFRCCFVHLETKKISGTKWKIFFYFMQFILWFEFHFFFFIGVFSWILIIIIIIHFGRAITRQDKCHDDDDDDDWWWWQRRRQRPHLLFTPFFSSDVCYFYSIFVHFFSFFVLSGNHLTILILAFFKNFISYSLSLALFWVKDAFNLHRK